MSNIEHPKHYQQADIECLDAIKAALSSEELKGFIKGNIIKYIWRSDHKNGLEDLQKAQWYLNWYLNL